MNNRLPTLKANEVIKALKRAGFIERRNTGKHSILKNPSTGKIIPIPTHGSKDIKRGTLFNIIKLADISIEDFIELL